MSKGRRLPDAELVHQVRTHLVYELKWLIFAADAFQRAEGGSYVAFLDSAAVHARNLFEFACKPDTNEFTLCAVGGVAKKSSAWDRWANNRVTHMGLRAHKARWPEGREAWEKPDKLIRMAAAVLDRLRDGGKTIPAGQLRESYNEVLAAAADYLANPTPRRHQALADLYDTSRDEPYPN